MYHAKKSTKLLLSLLKKPKTLEIAYGGIAAALSTLLLYLASLLPTGRIALFVICALIPQFFLKRRRLAVALCMFFAVSFLMTENAYFRSVWIDICNFCWAVSAGSVCVRAAS